MYVGTLHDCGSKYVNPFTQAVLFYPHAAERSLLVSPHILGCYGLLLSRFGHDRAKNNSRVILLSMSCVLPNSVELCGVSLKSQSCELLCLAVCAQWLVLGLFGRGSGS